MLLIVNGYINEANMLEVILSVVNMKLAGPITPITESSFPLSFANREEVRELVKLGIFKVTTKDGPCSLKLAYWSMELGVVGRMTGKLRAVGSPLEPSSSRLVLDHYRAGSVTC